MLREIYNKTSKESFTFDVKSVGCYTLLSNSDSFSNLKIINVKCLMKDPVPGKVDEKATQLHAIASLKVLLDATKPQRGAATSSAANHVKVNLKETTLGRPNGNIDATLDSVSKKIQFK